jgi:hypothetical protein
MIKALSIPLLVSRRQLSAAAQTTLSAVQLQNLPPRSEITNYCQELGN